MEVKVKEGWLCPNCRKIKSPDVKQCDCVKSEDVNKDKRQLLNENWG